MMDLSQRKEQFSHVYVHAVATVAGFQIYKYAVDDQSVDLGIAGRAVGDLSSAPRIDLQLKCTSTGVGREKHIVYPLKRKNYDDLRPTDLVVPRILVVVLVPKVESDWIQQSEEELIVRHCAYWTSLHGLEDIDNRRSISIRLPRRNIFSVDGLRDLMKRAGKKERL